MRPRSAVATDNLRSPRFHEAAAGAGKTDGSPFASMRPRPTSSRRSFSCGFNEAAAGRPRIRPSRNPLYAKNISRPTRVV